MKKLPHVLSAIGLLLLLAAVAGAVIGNPSRVISFKVTTVILAANTVFLLAI
jgi:hypothetical protein